jgi:4-diphosphocytidyl-2C-methyl-D-erythritol kinase
MDFHIAAFPHHQGCRRLRQDLSRRQQREHRAARTRHAGLQALQWLASQGMQGRMTGSGSAVFALMGPGPKRGQAPAGWQVRECGNLEAHPLAGWVSRDDSSVAG